jgi:hypothetical protein
MASTTTSKHIHDLVYTKQHAVEFVRSTARARLAAFVSLQRQNSTYKTVFAPQGCEPMKTLSSAIFVSMIYGILSPMTISMNFWRVGPTKIATPTPIVLLSRKLFHTEEKLLLKNNNFFNIFSIFSYTLL